ncbi:MAG: T9SS type A sorting domain-containing protein [Candidatus Azobacteroides sp.]|nr:T9SS type A sorting domain-containing protein [Candidatus Azobacteroides sp.]
MKKIFTLKTKRFSIAMIAMLMFSWSAALAQTVVFLETCGTTAPSAGTRPTPENYTGWDNGAPVTFSGTVDVRSTSALSSHVWFAANSDKEFIISGINTSGKSNLKLSFKVACNSASGDASKMTLTVRDAAAGGSEIPITVPGTPVGAQNVYVEINNLSGVPATTNLEIKFAFTTANNPANYGYRLDDILVSSGDAPVLSDNNNLATLTVTQGILSPEFDSAITSYSVELPAGTTAVPDVQYTVEDSKANATVTKAVAIPGTTTIKVAAENGNEKTYSVNFSALPSAGTWIETFEGESANKAGYTEAEFIGVASTWDVFGIVTSADANDKKNGTRSVRLRDPSSTTNSASHFIEMVQDKPNGAGVISLYHGMYSNHTAAATWKLEVSNNGGATWDAFSQEVTEVPTTFTLISFTVNVAGNIRIKITKTNDPLSNSTINIDDIQITDYPSTGNKLVNISDLNVYADNGTIYVKNLPEAAKVSVYDLAGKLITQTSATEIPLNVKGIYIVKVNNQAFKVANK